jgi:AGCS family alanine or glycine:cation symporter
MYGGIKSADLAWALGDVGVGAMAWLNIIAILILQRPALLALKDYETQLEDGFDPTFDAEAAGIDNADFWVKPKVK